MIGAPGYGVKMLVQNSAPGKRRHMSMMKRTVSWRSGRPSPGKAKMMLKEGRIPAAMQRAALS